MKLSEAWSMIKKKLCKVAYEGTVRTSYLSEGKIILEFEEGDKGTPENLADDFKKQFFADAIFAYHVDTAPYNKYTTTISRGPVKPVNTKRGDSTKKNYAVEFNFKTINFIPVHTYLSPVIMFLMSKYKVKYLRNSIQLDKQLNLKPVDEFKKAVIITNIAAVHEIKVKGYPSDTSMMKEVGTYAYKLDNLYRYDYTVFSNFKKSKVLPVTEENMKKIMGFSAEEMDKLFPKLRVYQLEHGTESDKYATLQGRDIFRRMAVFSYKCMVIPTIVYGLFSTIFGIPGTFVKIGWGLQVGINAGTRMSAVKELNVMKFPDNSTKIASKESYNIRRRKPVYIIESRATRDYYKAAKRTMR